MTAKIGLDCGTYNIISARVNQGKLEIARQINAFFSIPLEDNFMLTMIKNSGAHVIEVGDYAYILGEDAVKLAVSMGKEYRRPMKNGILSVNEKDAFNILAVIITAMVGKLDDEKTIVYYSVPANAINTDTNAGYHTKVLQSIFDKYKVNNKTIEAYPVNEALAIVVAELEKEQRTGIGISFGAGMVNVCYAMFSVPVVQFSITNSGDWIDEESAKHCGESVAYINQCKHDIDLSKEPSNSTERAIVYHYQLMIEKALKGIKDGIIKAGTKAQPGKAVNIVLAGGTASPKGFTELFKRNLDKMEFPIEIGEVYLAKDCLHTVAKGCLMISQAHQDK